MAWCSVKAQGQLYLYLHEKGLSAINLLKCEELKAISNKQVARV
jgi:hypothetical protein